METTRINRSQWDEPPLRREEMKQVKDLAAEVDRAWRSATARAEPQRLDLCSRATFLSGGAGEMLLFELIVRDQAWASSQGLACGAAYYHALFPRADDLVEMAVRGLREEGEPDLPRRIDLAVGGVQCSYYRSGEPIQGGLAVVACYEAVSGERTAVKFPKYADQDRADVERRFWHEFQCGMDVDHANVVRMLGFHKDEETGRPVWLAMEWVQGRSLASILEDKPILPVHQCLDYAIQICTGLGALYGRIGAHRDLTPGNVMITPEGQVKIIDLGLVVDENGTRKTQSKGELGTPGYTAPEQLDNPKTADKPADIYSLGAILYRMLTGQVPVPAASLHEARKKSREGAWFTPSRWKNPLVSRDLDCLLRRCLMRLPEHRRFGSPVAVPANSAALVQVLVLKEELGRVLEEQRVLTRPPQWIEIWREYTPVQKWLRVAGTAVAVAVVLIMIAGGISWSAKATNRETVLLQELEAQLAPLESAPVGEIQERLQRIQGLQDQIRDAAPAKVEHSNMRVAAKLAALVDNVLLQLPRPTPSECGTADLVLESLQNLDPVSSRQRRIKWTEWLGEWTQAIAAPETAAWPDVFSDPLALTADDGGVRAKQPRPEGSSLSPGIHPLKLDVARHDVRLLAAFRQVPPGEVAQLALGPTGALSVTASVWNPEPALWQLAVGTETGKLLVGSPRSGIFTEHYAGPLSPIRSLAWSSSGERIAILHADGTVALDENGKPPRKRKWATFKPHEVLFLGDSREVVVSGRDDQRHPKIDRWILDEDRVQAVAGVSPQLATVAVHPSEPVLALGDQQGKVAIHHIKNQSLTVYTPRGNQPARILGFVAQPPSLVMMREDGCLEFVDSGNTRLLKEIAGPVPSAVQLASDPNGEYFATATANGRVDIYNRKSGAITMTRVLAGSPFSSLHIVSDSQQSRLVAVDRFGQHQLMLLGNPESTAPACHPGLALTRCLVQRPAPAEGTVARVRIYDRGILLAEGQVPDPGEAFEVTAIRKGNDIRVLLNGKEVLHAQNILQNWNLAQVAAVGIPGGAQLTQLRADLLRGIRAESPLTKGDDLMAAGNVVAAGQEYERFAADPKKDSRDRHEAAYKSALCLEQLNRFDEAQAQLGKIALDEPTRADPLPALANLELLRLITSQLGDHSDFTVRRAAELFERLNGKCTFRHEPEEVGLMRLSSLAPTALRDQLSHWTFDVGRRTPDAERMALVLHWGDFLGDSEQRQIDRHLDLYEAYSAQDNIALADQQVDEAIARSQRLISRDPSALRELFVGSERVARGVERQSWRRRLQGKDEAQAALDEVRDWNQRLTNAGLQAGTLLLLEEARLQTALGNPQEARNILQQLLAERPILVDMTYGYYVQARVMLGFLQADLGDQDAARQTWRETSFQNWRSIAQGAPNASVDEEDEELIARGYALLARALEGPLDLKELESLEDNFVRSYTKTFGTDERRWLVFFLQTQIDDAKWKRYARDILAEAHLAGPIRGLFFKTRSFRDLTREFPVAIAREIVKRDAGLKSLSPDQERLLEYLADRGLKSYFRGNLKLLDNKVKAGELVSLWDRKITSVFVLKSIPDPGGSLGGAAGFLEPPLRAPITYLFGLRYKHLGKTAEAVKFFELAKAVSDEIQQDGELRELVQRLVGQQLAPLNAAE